MEILTGALLSSGMGTKTLFETPQVNYLKIDMRVHFEAYELLPITANNVLDFKTVFKTFQAQRSCA